jgi:hypothetical protein
VFKLTPPAAGETEWIEAVLYRFSGKFDGDGAHPFAGLIIDARGALYGTTSVGGTGCFGCGTVFQLTPPAAGATKWTEGVLYSFTGFPNGINPEAGLIMDARGALYGTTNGGRGTVFKLTPPAAGETEWIESVLYRFSAKFDGDGASPVAGLITDASGALYGTTYNGGAGCPGINGCGTVFEVVP